VEVVDDDDDDDDDVVAAAATPSLAVCWFCIFPAPFYPKRIQTTIATSRYERKLSIGGGVPVRATCCAWSEERYDFQSEVG
jgi:hypothetical protein